MSGHSNYLKHYSRAGLRCASLALALGLASAAASAQNRAPNSNPTEASAPMNILQLSADGVVEVQQDWLTATLNTVKEGRDAAAVQSQLQQAMEAALSVGRAQAKPGELELSSGNYSVTPRYDRNGKIDGWQGRAELSMQGRNFVKIMQTAAKMDSLQLGGTMFSISREARDKVTGEAQAKAIEEFNRQASSLARNFGFASYQLREVNVSTATGGGYQPRPMMLAKANMAGADAAPMPVEAGTAQVMVNVSGSVQMQ